MRCTNGSCVKLAVGFLGICVASYGAVNCSAQSFDSKTHRFAFAELNDDDKLVITIATPATKPTPRSIETPAKGVSGNGLREEQYEVRIPVTKVVSQTYTIKVPYSEKITKDGKEAIVQRTREETRTRKVPVTTYVTEQRVRMVKVDKGAAESAVGAPVDLSVEFVLAASDVKIFTLGGDPIEWTKAKEKLSKKRPVLVVSDSIESIKPIKPFLNKNLIVIWRVPKS